MSRLSKFEDTSIAWFIFLFPFICGIIFTVNYIFNLGLESANAEYGLLIIISFLVDILLLLFISAVLMLIDEYEVFKK